jgi:hypothetical protein
MSNFKVRLVITWAGLVSGVGAILLPFAYSTSAWEATFEGELWPVAVPFYLALAIGVASLGTTRSGLAMAGLRVVGWIAAAASGAVTTYFFLSSALREPPSLVWEWFGLAALLAVLAAGAVLVLRRGRAARSILAMQVAYVANVQGCLFGFAGEWQSGAWCALVTVLLYVVQIGAEMNRKSAAPVPSNGRPATSAFARLIVMAISAASITASGCGGSPTQPSQGERIALYSGQWRALIGDVRVVVQIHAVRGFFAPVLDGTGSAVNVTTGETNQLKISGSGMMSDDSGSGSFFNISMADEVTEGRTTPGGSIGQFTGHILADGRTWTGRYRAWSNFTDYVDIFGVADVPVTFAKD